MCIISNDDNLKLELLNQESIELRQRLAELTKQRKLIRNRPRRRKERKLRPLSTWGRSADEITRRFQIYRKGYYRKRQQEKKNSIAQCNILGV